MKFKLLLTSLTSFLLLFACGDKDKEANLSPEEKVETRALALLSSMEKIPGALMKVKDDASFAKAKEEIREIRAELHEKAEELAKLPPLDSEKSQEIEAHLDKAGEKVKEDMMKVMTHLHSLENPELMKKVGEMMQDFGEDMESISEKIDAVIKK